MILPSELTLGPFKIDRSGLLCPATPLSFPHFAVHWRGRMLTSSMRQYSAEDATHGELELKMRIGRVPSSVLVGAPQRQSALMLVRHLPRLLPDSWHARLMPDYTIMLETTLAISLPVSAVGLVSEVALFLLRLSPYLDELDAEGLSRPATLQ